MKIKDPKRKQKAQPGGSLEPVGSALDLITARAETLEVSGGHEESFAIRRLAQVVADLARVVKQNQNGTGKHRVT